MCTVTFIPVNNKYYITSNRDEKIARKTAMLPQIYESSDAKILYPKDGAAGGTWIALHENGNAMVLLNGGFEKHISQPPYRKSRGIVFLEIFNTASPLKKFLTTSLLNIEPFTLIILEANNLYECRWDSNKKHTLQLQTTQSYIWSSATLYNNDIIAKRNEWFAAWRQTNPFPSLQNILHFHQFTGDGDAKNDLCMNRNNAMLTVSITAIELRESKGIMHYSDLIENKQYHKEFQLASSYAL